MRSFRDYPIRWKLTAAITASTGLALLLVFAVYAWNETIKTRKTELEKLATFAETTGFHCITPLLFDDPAAAQVTLKALSLSDAINSAQLYKSDGELFAAYRRDGAAQPELPVGNASEAESAIHDETNPLSGEFWDDNIHLVHPIQFEGNRIGSIAIEADLSEMWHTLYRNFLTLGLASLASFLMAMLFAARFNRIIAVPIANLAQVASAVSSERNYSLRVGKQNDDELGVLIDGFNGMLTQIEARDVELERHRNHLEQLVEMRTSELKHAKDLAEQVSSQISEQRDQLEQQVVALRLRDLAMEASVNAIIITRCEYPDYPIEYVNPAFERITGYSREEVIGRDCRFLQGEERHQPELEKLRAALRDLHETHVVLRNYRKDGQLFWNDLYVAPVRDADGTVTHFVGIQNDVSDFKRYEEQLEHQANHDTLTGLPNRNLLNDRLHQALALAQRYNHPVGVAFIDLDQFKFINDSLGHHIGDEVLKIVAARLTSCVRDGDTVARLGGDEFVLVLADHLNDENIPLVMDRLLQAICQPFALEAHEFYLTCSIGLSLFPQDGNDVHTLIKSADAAMYRAKESGRNNYQFFTREMNLKITERLSLTNSLRRALEREEFFLVYQPKVDLQTGSIIGGEALVRWSHPEQGEIAPARFIPLAEETGLIVPLGEWVLRTACMQNLAWQRQGLPEIEIAVNVSARQCYNVDLKSTVSRVLSDTGLPPRCLELELTESLVMDQAENFITTLSALKELGIGLSIDDFGTGYSSLSYLKRFPVDRLKIDQSFVRDITSDPDDAVIAQLVILLGHSLNLRVVAEGVETEAQLEFLRTQGCDEVQGYFLSRPLPADAFAELLRQSLPSKKVGT